MEKRTWKTIAIILLVIFVLETIFLIWIFNLGMRSVNQENECSYNVCSEAESYYFDDYEKICYCYKQGEIIKSEYLG